MILLIAGVILQASVLAQYRMFIVPANPVVGERFTAVWGPLMQGRDGIRVDTYPDPGGLGQEYTNPDRRFGLYIDGEFVGNTMDFFAPSAGVYQTSWTVFTGWTIEHPAVSAPFTVHPNVDAVTSRFPETTASGPIVAFGGNFVVGEGFSTNFTTLLSQRLGKEVLNKGTAGLTTGGALTRLEAEVLPLSPRLTLLVLGDEDSAQEEDPETTKENLRSMIRSLYSRGSMVILVGLHVKTGDGLSETFHSLWEEEKVAFVPNANVGSTYWGPAKPERLHLEMADRILPTLVAIDAIQVPEVPVIPTMGITLSGGQIQVSWQETPSQRFNLWSSPRVGAAASEATGTLTRSSGGAIFTVTPTTNARYFYLRKGEQ